jgi:nucleoid-associated protein YgaU
MRTGKIITLIPILVILLVFCNFFTTYIADAHTDRPDVYREVVVQPTDTLWDIAAAYTPAGKDVRNTIYQIRKLNKLDTAMVHPGQRLLLPHL